MTIREWLREQNAPTTLRGWWEQVKAIAWWYRP
jgi:hypothetical protein